MFVISGTYKVPMEEVDRVLPAHREFLDKYFAEGAFLCSGPMNPRVGGLILCNAGSLDEVVQIMQEDPFQRERISEYTITEFAPTKACAEMQVFITK